jgi:hypothetical protein
MAYYLQSIFERKLQKTFMDMGRLGRAPLDRRWEQGRTGNKDSRHRCKNKDGADGSYPTQAELGWAPTVQSPSGMKPSCLASWRRFATWRVGKLAGLVSRRRSCFFLVPHRRLPTCRPVHRLQWFPGSQKRDLGHPVSLFPVSCLTPPGPEPAPLEFVAGWPGGAEPA